MTTAQTILEAAYSRSTANDPGKLATDAELIGRLNRTYQGLYTLAARQRPDQFTSSGSSVVNGVDVGITIPTDTTEIRRLENVFGAQVHLIPAGERARLWHAAPSMYQVGNRVRSRMASGDPMVGDTIFTWLLLPAAALVVLASTIDVLFPTRHHETLINDLALYLDAKDEGRDPEQFRKLAADQAMKLAAFAQEYALDASALEFVHSTSTRVPAKGGGA